MTKKFLLMSFAGFMLVMAGIFLTACGDDNSNSGNDTIHQNAEMLQGDTWTFEKASVSIMGQTIEMTLSQIRELYASQMGTSNILFVDEKIKFEEDYVLMVKTGDRFKYKYFSDGKLWIEGMDNIEGMSMNMRVKSLTANRLELTCNIKASGITISEDLYYKR